MTLPRAQDPVGEFFAKSELLSELDGGLQDRFTEGAREIRISIGDTLLRQGDPITHIYGLISGRMEAATLTAEGRQLTVDSYGPGEFCGEIGVVDGVLSNADLRATEDCRLILLNRTKFLELLYSSPEFSFRIFTLIDTQLRARTVELKETKLYGLNARLAKRLLLAAEPNGDGEQGPEEIRSEQADIAHRLGVHAVAVNRHLKKWEANGWLKTGRGHISLIDRDAIARVAAPILAADESESGSPTPWARFDLITTAPRSQQMPESGRQCFLVIEAEDYSQLLHADVKRTIEALNKRIRSIFALVGNAGGQVLSHTGDVVLVGVSEATKAIDVATRIQEKIATAERKRRGPVFRIGISEGDYVQRQSIIESDAIREATSVAAFARAGDVWITRAVARQLDSAKHGIRKLGEFELKNLPRKITVYSASRLTSLSAIRLRLQPFLPQRHRSIWATAAILVLLSATFWIGQEVYEASGPSIPANSLAIIPFTYDEGDESAPYIADGIGRELGYRLSAVPELIVAGLSSSHYLSENRDDFKAIGRTFGVAYVLTGHLAIRKNVLVVELSLHDTADSSLAWHRTNTLDHSELVSIQQSAMSDILGYLQIADTQDDSSHEFGGTSNPDAYRAYLNANYLSTTDDDAALDWYLKAIALDPEYADPYASLAILAFSSRSVALSERLPGTKMEMALKAIELGPNSARSHVALLYAQWGNEDYSAARVAIDRALALNDSDPLLLQQASIILALNEDYEGWFNLIGRAWELNPVDPIVGARYVQSLEERNEIEEAKRVLKELQRLHPKSDGLQFWDMNLAWQSREYRRAYSILQKKPNGSDPLEEWRLIFEIIVGYVDPASIRDDTASIDIGDLRRLQYRFDEALNLVEQDFARTNAVSDGLRVARWLALTGRFQESRDLFESFRQQYRNIDTKAFFWGMYGTTSVVTRDAVIQLWALTKLGRTEDASKLERQLLERIHWSFQSNARDRSLYVAEAQIHAIMGRNAEAMASLRNSLDGLFIRSVFLRRNPLLENLHTEPEFWSLIAEVEATLAEIRQDIDAVRAGLAE